MFFTEHEISFMKMVVIAKPFVLLYGHRTNCAYRLKSETDMSDF